MSILMPVLITLHILVCALLVLVVLMQRPRSEGLGSAFGGGITDNVFGSQTTQVLTRFTTWMGIAFFVITLLLSILTAKMSTRETAVQKELLSAPAPVVPASTPAPEPVIESTPAPVATPESVQPTPVATPEISSEEPTAPAAAEAMVVEETVTETITPSETPVEAPAPAAPPSEPAQP